MVTAYQGETQLVKSYGKSDSLFITRTWYCILGENRGGDEGMLVEQGMQINYKENGWQQEKHAKL